MIVENIHRTNAVVDRGRIDHVNQLHMQAMLKSNVPELEAELAQSILLMQSLARELFHLPADHATLCDAYMVRAMRLLSSRLPSIGEIMRKGAYLWESPKWTDHPTRVEKLLVTGSRAWLEKFANELSATSAPELSAADVDAGIQRVTKAAAVPKKAVMLAVRFAVSGEEVRDNLLCDVVLCCLIARALFCQGRSLAGRDDCTSRPPTNTCAAPAHPRSCHLVCAAEQKCDERGIVPPAAVHGADSHARRRGARKSPGRL